jgi:hypothetical protein
MLRYTLRTLSILANDLIRKAAIFGLEGNMRMSRIRGRLDGGCYESEFPGGQAVSAAAISRQWAAWFTGVHVFAIEKRSTLVGDILVARTRRQL